MNAETTIMLNWLREVNSNVRNGHYALYINGYGIIRDIRIFKGQELVDKLKEFIFLDWDKIETEFECIGCGKKITLADILKDGLTGSTSVEEAIQDLYKYKTIACDECIANETVRRCRLCEHWCVTDDMSYIDGYKIYICDDCYDNEVRTCDRCGDVIIQQFDDNYIIVGGDIYCCSNCAIADGYTTCDDCGEWVHQDDVYCGDDCMYRCADCHYNYEERQEEVDDEEDEGEYVKSYGWKPNPKFKCITDDPTPNTYYGFELEVSGSQREAPAFLDFFGDSHDIHDNVYLKSDCSIVDGGFEIVTHPMTAEYIRKEFKPKLANGLKYLRQCHFRGHNRGGMHIHVSRRAITLKMFERMCELLYDRGNKDKWLVLTQRKESELDHWASLNRHRYDECCTFNEGYASSSRYVGMNLTNNTVEFRIFNSNLRLERVLKNLELVEALVNFSKTKYKPTMRMFLGYIKVHKQRYSNAYDFIVEKNWNSRRNEFVTEENETIEV